MRASDAAVPGVWATAWSDGAGVVAGAAAIATAEAVTRVTANAPAAAGTAPRGMLDLIDRSSPNPDAVVRKVWGYPGSLN
ncbi:hypothetical protein Acsp01_45850 [Actinoplanes sp. NBRC 101535]|nr:hypothetical protein Acsp01_45850 [Actinoplanes sp. NBRC 101535]